MNDILNHLIDEIMFYWYALYFLPTEVRFFIQAAMALLLCSACLMITLYLRRWYLNAKENKQKDLKFRFQYFIYDALVESSKQEVLSSTAMIVRKFKQHELNSAMEKQLMINLMIELKKNFSGNAKKQFEHLYVCLGLHHISVAKLRSSNIQERIKGIRELSEMNYQCEALERALTEWQLSPHEQLADEVKIAAIKCQSSHMLSFLNNQDTPLSDWLQIQLRYHLEALPAEQRPNFSQWLNAPSPSAIVFVLQMIVLFQQKGCVKQISQLLHHSSDTVKSAAIGALEQLEAREEAGALFNVLDTNNTELKIEALHAIGLLGQLFHAKLLNPLLQHPSAKIKRASQRAISRINARNTSTGNHAALTAHTITS